MHLNLNKTSRKKTQYTHQLNIETTLQPRRLVSSCTEIYASDLLGGLDQFAIIQCVIS